MVDVVPVDVSEERVGHDLLRISRSRAKAHLGLAGEQLLKDGDTIAGHVNWVERFVGENGVVDFIFVFSTEGRLLK